MNKKNTTAYELKILLHKKKNDTSTRPFYEDDIYIQYTHTQKVQVGSK